MKIAKLIFIFFALINLFSFTNYSSNSISILQSSEDLLVYDFSLDNKRVVLKSGNDFNFFVTVKSRKVNGKKNIDYKKVKKQGIRYVLTYTYEYLPSEKKMYSKQDFIIWNDGEIENWKSSEIVVVEGIKITTKVN